MAAAAQQKKLPLIGWLVVVTTGFAIKTPVILYSACLHFGFPVEIWPEYKCSINEYP